MQTLLKKQVNFFLFLENSIQYIFITFISHSFPQSFPDPPSHPYVLATWCIICAVSIHSWVRGCPQRAVSLPSATSLRTTESSSPRSHHPSPGLLRGVEVLPSACRSVDRFDPLQVLCRPPQLLSVQGAVALACPEDTALSSGFFNVL